MGYFLKATGHDPQSPKPSPTARSGRPLKIVHRYARVFSAKRCGPAMGAEKMRSVTGTTPLALSVVYQLRVVLAQISPMIWRRLLIPAQTTIAELHQVLQIVFGWSDEHLHQFTIHGVEHGLPRHGGFWFSHDARVVTLARFGLREGERFRYDYNFFDVFDCWCHDIRVEKILTPVAGRRYPVCTGGARCAPPEDCGGPQAFLALRQKHSVVATTVRMAELLAPLLELGEDDARAFRHHVEEHREEMAELLYWHHIDDFDRAAANQALHAHPDTGGITL